MRKSSAALKEMVVLLASSVPVVLTLVRNITTLFAKIVVR